jgi:hypothetical protein
MMPEYERELGEMSAKITILEITVSEMRQDLRTVRDTLTEAKGSWRTLVAVAGLSASLGAFLVKLFPFIPRL